MAEETPISSLFSHHRSSSSFWFPLFLGKPFHDREPVSFRSVLIVRDSLNTRGSRNAKFDHLLRSSFSQLVPQSFSLGIPSRPPLLSVVRRPFVSTSSLLPFVVFGRSRKLGPPPHRGRRFPFFPYNSLFYPRLRPCLSTFFLFSFSQDPPFSFSKRELVYAPFSLPPRNTFGEQ